MKPPNSPTPTPMSPARKLDPLDDYFFLDIILQPVLAFPVLLSLQIVGIDRHFSVFYQLLARLWLLAFIMSYRPNFGNNYDYPVQPNLGYSNVSRSYNKFSTKNGPQEHAGFGEVEFMLENERKKFREAKDRFETDLDNERKRRIEFENKLIKLKDEFSRKEVSLSEAEFKINNLLHQNQDLAVENDKLKHELARIEELYGGKIHELQTQLQMETQNFEETTLQYNQEFQKFKKEGQDYVEQLTFEMERKIKNLEEKLKSVELVKRDLAMENKKLNDLLISNRLQFEEQLRDIKNRARDEEVKKAQYLAKSFEQKLKALEDGKEALARKLQEMHRLVQDKDAKILELEGDLDEETGKLRQDRSDMQEQINQLTYIVNKLKAEIAEKDNLIGRSVSDNDGEIRSLKQQLEGKRQEIAQLQGSIRDLRLTLKDVESEGERKRRQLAERCYSLETESRRYKQEYTRLAEILKSKINSTIDNVSFPKK